MIFQSKSSEIRFFEVVKLNLDILHFCRNLVYEAHVE